MPTKIKGRKTQQKDPVCGMEIEIQGAPSETFEGTTYVFCSEECREKFQSSPSDYVEF